MENRKSTQLKPCKTDLQFLILLYQRAGCQHKLCEKSDYSYLIGEIVQFYKKTEAHQQVEINYCLKPRLNLKRLTIIILMITQTKVNKTKTMKQTKRAILEESRAPQAPLLICSKDAPKL